MNACVKKKPEIQYTVGGRPRCTQSPKKAKRSKRSLTHAPNGFKEGYATEDHTRGTLPFTIESPMSSNSADITTNPFMAFWTSARVFSITSTSLLKRINSCVSTVFILSSYLW